MLTKRFIYKLQSRKWDIYFLYNKKFPKLFTVGIALIFKNLQYLTKHEK